MHAAGAQRSENESTKQLLFSSICFGLVDDLDWYAKSSHFPLMKFINCPR